jgi:hypothetical protein
MHLNPEYMNELNINIIRTPARSVARKVLGVLSMALGVIWSGYMIVADEKAPVTSIIMSIYILVIGLIYFIDGSGIPVSGWFGEAYLKIDKTGICIKKGVFSKEWFLLWDEIEKVRFSVIKIIFNLKDKTERELEYDNLEYEHIQAIKKCIISIGGEKNIECIMAPK